MYIGGVAFIKIENNTFSFVTDLVHVMGLFQFEMRTENVTTCSYRAVFKVEIFIRANCRMPIKVRFKFYNQAFVVVIHPLTTK